MDTNTPVGLQPVSVEELYTALGRKSPQQIRAEIVRQEEDEKLRKLNERRDRWEEPLFQVPDMKDFPEGTPERDLYEYAESMPGLESLRVESAATMANLFGEPFEKVYKNYDTYKETLQVQNDQEMKRITDYWKDSYTMGKIVNQRGKVGFQLIQGKGLLPGADVDESLWLEIDKYNKQLEEIQGRREDPGNFMQKGVGQALELIPMIAKGLERGGQLAILTTPAGAGLGAAFGGVGAVPGAVAGFTAGLSTGTAQHTMEVESGNFFVEAMAMRDEQEQGVSPRLARTAALGVGFLNSIIEVAQVKDIMSTVPGLKKVYKDNVSNVVKRFLTDGTIQSFIAKRAGHVATETGEEALQELVSIIGEESIKKINNNVQGTRFEAAWRDAAPRIAEVMKSTAGGFAILQLPGGFTDAVKMASTSMADVVAQSPEYEKLEWAATIARLEGEGAAKTFLEEQGLEVEDIDKALVQYSREAQSEKEVMAFREEWTEKTGMSEEEVDAGIAVMEAFARKRGLTGGEFIKRYVVPELETDINRFLLEAPEEPGPTTTAFDEKVPVVEIPVDTLDLSKDVPNFKEGADLSGVVEPIQAEKYERLGTAPIVVWERTDGSMEVITGRHRLDLARRTGEDTIPAQIVKESEGFTKDMAAIFDAESNIRDGQGSVRDYANYFRTTGISIQEASRRGLLSRAKGRNGYAIGAYASDGLYTLYRNGRIGEKKAAAIAAAAPNNEQVQALGIKKAKDLSADELAQYVKILSQAEPTQKAEQGNLFGEDESFMQEAERIAKAAAKRINDLKEELSTLKKAQSLGKKARADLLAKYGFKTGDEEALAARIEELEREVYEWEGWATDPEKMAELQGGPDTLFQQAPPVESEAFKRWFGDSKVTADEIGTPLVVYHGTPDARFIKKEGFTSPLERLQRKGYGNLDYQDKDRAFFFSSSRRTASTYADDARAFNYQYAEPEVLPVYLKIENPMVLDWGGKTWSGTEKTIQKARAKGHDGVIIKNVRDDYYGIGEPSDVYVAFSPEQVKSVYNKGTWDPESPNILFQAEGWHGSPHAFDRFSTEYVGTGEGAQAFGWGVYITSKEEIGRHYANMLGQPGIINWKIKGITLYDNGNLVDYSPRGNEYFDQAKAVFIEDLLIEEGQIKIAYEKYGKEGVFEYIRETMQRLAQGYREEANINPEYAEYNNSLAEQIEKLIPKTEKDIVYEQEKARNLYRVRMTEHADFDDAIWIDWYEDVTGDQKLKVAEQLKKEELAEDQWADFDVENAEQFIEQYLDDVDGETLYGTLQDLFRDPSGRETSLFLNRAGIDGIRYPAGSLSGGEGDSNNYVVFDGNAVTIEEHIQYQKGAEGVRAGVQFSELGQALFYASRQADFSSFIHEMGHVWRRLLTPNELQVFENWIAAEGIQVRDEQGRWTREAEEMFAQGLEQYLRESAAPNPQVASLWERFKVWLRDIYDRFAKYHMNEDVKRAYEDMFEWGTDTTTQEPPPTPPPPQGPKDQAMAEAAGSNNPEGAELAAAYEQLKDSWFKDRAEWVHKSQTKATRNVKQLLDILGKKKYDAEAKETDLALAIFREIEAHPEVLEYVQDLPEDKQAIVEKAQNLSQELKQLARQMGEDFDAIGHRSLDAEVIGNVREGYVGHIWDLENRHAEYPGRKFSTKTGHAKPRVFNTIIDGWLQGYELKVEGMTQNLQVIEETLYRTIYDKRFLDAMKKVKDTEGNPLLTTYQREGYVALENRHFKNWDYAGTVDVRAMTRSVRELVAHTVQEERATREGGTREQKTSKPVKKLEQIITSAMVQRGMTEAEARTALQRVKEAAKNIDDSADVRVQVDEIVKTVENTIIEREEVTGFEFEPVLSRDVVVTEDGTVLRARPLFAPKPVAKNLNQILGQSKLKGIPAIDFITKYNAVMKSWILQSSFFHHMAYMQSYLLGTNRKHFAELSPRQAYRAGLEAIEEDNPVIILGVREGLTLGIEQDWNKAAIDQMNDIDRLIEKIPMVNKVKMGIKMMRDAHTNFLFKKLGAGLKAKAFMLEYRDYLRRHPDTDPNTAARYIANLINDDFGGLNLQRMGKTGKMGGVTLTGGRNPTVQHIMRLFLLAPDWTESNIRSFVKAFKAGEEGALYRRFWAGILLKGAAVTLAANFALAGGDPERFLENYRIALEAGKYRFLGVDIRKLTAVDITPIYKALGGTSEERKYFSFFGHFIDPFRFMLDPIRSANNKGSVIFRTFFEALSGINWAGRPFTDTEKLLETGQTVGFGSGGAITYAQIPSYIISQIIGTQPVQVQNLLAWLAGEIEAFDAITTSLGLRTTTTYGRTKEKEQGFFEE